MRKIIYLTSALNTFLTSCFPLLHLSFTLIQCTTIWWVKLKEKHSKWRRAKWKWKTTKIFSVVFPFMITTDVTFVLSHSIFDVFLFFFVGFYFNSHLLLCFGPVITSYIFFLLALFRSDRKEKYDRDMILLQLVSLF